MADFYGITFLETHGDRSGDAMAIQYELNGQKYVHVVDGGYAGTASAMASQLRYRYGTTHIDHMVVTHPHQDHAEGLAEILDTHTVGTLWMLRPWLYAQELLPYFGRYSSAECLAERLREAAGEDRRT
jgi:glyoxylase-like metal-dependent hydrolase (beta-lactamase superfamily II)